MGLYVKLDTNWVNHPKLLRAGIDGAGAHAVAMCLAKQMETDGWIDRILLTRYGIGADLADRLVELRLFEADGDRVRPWGWLDRNPSQGAIDARRDAKREAARRGNHKRWEHPGEFEDCATCHPLSQVIACSDRSSSHHDPTRSPETETKTEPAADESHPATTATARAKQAAVVLARRQIAPRVAAGAIAHPEAVANRRAEEDLWPVLASMLTVAAEEHPDWSLDELADHAEPDPLLPAGPRRTPAADPAAVEAAREAARRREAETRDRLASGQETARNDRAGLAQVRLLKRGVS
jgi:hypothetical protein